jgi:hypothetical protein
MTFFAGEFQVQDQPEAFQTFLHAFLFLTKLKLYMFEEYKHSVMFGSHVKLL